MSWHEMIGMPSRLTAPIDEYQKRQSALTQVLKNNAIKGYQGTRINSKGERFLINDARIWTIWNEAGLPIGQAATFDTWTWK